MADLPETRLEETLPVGAAEDASGLSRAYLLVFAGGSSTLTPLFPNTELLVGRAENANLRLLDASVSRLHARLTTDASETRVTDLGSHNGTRVNGERLEGARTLASGDVIVCGAITLVFHRDPQPPQRRPLLEAAQLRQRLEEEIERSLRYQRAVTVVAVELGSSPGERERIGALVSAQLRLVDAAAWLGERLLVAILPETVGEIAGSPASRLLRALSDLAPEARAGLAACPVDGTQVDALIASAREAAHAALPGAVRAASDAASVMRVGDRQIVVADPAMMRLFGLIERLAPSPMPVLLHGATGTGKEIAASALHHWSPRRMRALVPVNCAALQETLVESELFGYERGAFTGADSSKAGLFEMADAGTLFLDEVGELSASAQAKLLRIIETQKLGRLGATVEKPINVRLVAATNRSLEEDVKAGRFRQDLYYRLSAATLVLPPLRDRPADLPLLAKRFLVDACARLNRPAAQLTPAALACLSSHAWPGNLRELKNTMDFVAATVSDRIIHAWHLPEKFRVDASGRPLATMPEAVPPEPADALPAAPAEFRNIYEEIRELERARIVAALESVGGVQAKAAKLIGMPVRTFISKMKQYGIPSSRLHDYGKGE